MVRQIPHRDAPEAAPVTAGLLDELRWRGMFHDATPGLTERLRGGPPIAGYNGFDPTGSSLHIEIGRAHV